MADLSIPAQEEAKRLEGTKTQANLIEAFNGETSATVKYLYYGKQAAKDGYQQIKAIFDETSGNEMAHAKLWFNLLHEGKMPDTIKNLEDAAFGENFEYEDMYERMAKEAKEEGFPVISNLFRMVGEIEKNHRDRYNKLLSNIKDGEVFQRSEKTTWICRNCGHIYVGDKAPEICPVCQHPRAYFQIEAQNY